MKGYGEDLALIHEDGFAQLARGAAAVLVRRLRARRVREGLVVDVGCGGGSLATALVDAGYDVLGLDVSRAMIRLARQREPRATFRAASYRRAKLPRCAAVTAVGETLSYLFDPGVNDRALDAFLRRAHAALLPGGCLLFDVVERRSRPERREGWTADARGRWAVLFRVREERGVVRREIVSFRKFGTTFRRRSEVHRQRRFSRTAILRMLRRAGFAVRVLRGYGSVRFREGQTGFLATKKLEVRSR